MKPIQVRFGETAFKIEKKDGGYLVNDAPIDFQLSGHTPVFRVHTSSRVMEFEILHREGNQITLKGPSGTAVLEVEDPLHAVLQKMGISSSATSSIQHIKSPMPGVILEVAVSSGQEVKKGDKLLVLEAMKMENVIKSPMDGTLTDVKVSQGQSVEKNEVLISF